MFPAARSSVLRTARTQLLRSQPIAVPQYSAFARLASTLAVLEQKDGKFQPASLAAVTAGTKLGGSITAFIAGSGVKSVAEEIGKAQGIEKVIYVENGAYDKVRSLREVYRRQDLTVLVGTPRKLCATPGREHQEGRLLTRHCWPHCFWQELDAASVRAFGQPADLRHHSH
jgi:hypothetical protein